MMKNVRLRLALELLGGTRYPWCIVPGMTVTTAEWWEQSIPYILRYAQVNKN